MLVEWSCRLALDRRRKQARRIESLLLCHELVDVLLAGSSICLQWKWVMKALLEACNTKVFFFSFFVSQSKLILSVFRADCGQTRQPESDKIQFEAQSLHSRCV